MHTHTHAADDIQAYLKSRHGIVVDLGYLKDHVMADLAGALNEDTSECTIDVTELTALLIGPHLLAAAAANTDDVTDDNNNELFGRVLNIILQDVLGTSMEEEAAAPTLDTALVKKILENYGEDDVSPEVLQEMVDAATGGSGAVLDAEALEKATTADLQQFDLNWQNDASTYYDDVLDNTALDANLADNEEDELAESEFDSSKDKVKRIWTAPTVDFIAENYRNRLFSVFLWVLGIVAFALYVNREEFGAYTACSSTHTDRDSFGCRVGNSIIRWLYTFCLLS